MNNIINKIAIMLAMLSCSGSILAYTWTFTNVTNHPIIIEFRLMGHPKIYYDILNPGENSSRFDWPWGIWPFTGSLKAGYCLSAFLVGTLNEQDMKNLFGKIKRPNAAQIENVCNNAEKRKIIARIGKRNPNIKWLSEESWGTFSKGAKTAVNLLTTSVTKLAGTTLDMAAAAGTEVATGGTTGGQAGLAAYKLQLGKILTVLDVIPGAIMDLAEKSRCTSRDFDIIQKVTKNAKGKITLGELVAVTKQ